MVSDFFDLFYPKKCVVCGGKLLKNEKALCAKCIYDIPRTRFHIDKENEVAKLFWGRVKIEDATSFFYYKKGSSYQQCIHQLKYKANIEAGEELGEIFGYELLPTHFRDVDIIIPVPLHKRKQKIRGFNQSDIIAGGLSRAIKKPVVYDAIKRSVYTDTQTRRSRFERWQNVEKIFEVKKKEKLINKKILLVDDVVTTGSTLEACASEILKVPHTRIKIATLAVAVN